MGQKGARTENWITNFKAKIQQKKILEPKILQKKIPGPKILVEKNFWTKNSSKKNFRAEILVKKISGSKIQIKKFRGQIFLKNLTFFTLILVGRNLLFMGGTMKESQNIVRIKFLETRNSHKKFLKLRNSYEKISGALKLSQKNS